MQVATPFAHLIEQLDGSGRDPVRFVRSVMPVHASRMMLCRIDFKHFFWCRATLFNDHGCGYPVFGQINHKLGNNGKAELAQQSSFLFGLRGNWHE